MWKISDEVIIKHCKASCYKLVKSVKQQTSYNLGYFFLYLSHFFLLFIVLGNRKKLHITPYPLLSGLKK